MRGAPLFFNIPSQTLGSNGISGNFGDEYTLNATFVNGGGGTVTLTLIDKQGAPRTYSIVSSAPAIVKRATVRSWSLTGNGASIAGAFSWPDEVDPSSIQVSAPISISGTVKTDIGQQTLGAIDPRQIRNLGAGDQPDVTQNQNATFGIGVQIKKPLSVSGYTEVFAESSP